MADDSLKERGNALEEEFFRKQNAELVERLRSSKARDEAREHMATVSGVSDPALVDQLLQHGVTPATFAALTLAPLVSVAWADGKLEDKERRAILQEAASSGLQAGSAEYLLLEDWLATQPPASLMAAWTGYARGIAASLAPDQRREFSEGIVRKATAVASAAGGFAGRAKTSPEERRVLDAVESALAS